MQAAFQNGAIDHPEVIHVAREITLHMTGTNPGKRAHLPSQKLWSLMSEKIEPPMTVLAYWISMIEYSISDIKLTLRTNGQTIYIIPSNEFSQPVLRLGRLNRYMKKSSRVEYATLCD
jgi:hypothetical protein